MLTFKPFTLWLMGPTSSGKTTLANFFIKEWRDKGVQVINYDGDEVRSFFGQDFGFKSGDRLQVVQTIIYLTKKARASGLNVIVSALTAHPEMRDLISSELNDLVVGYIRCPINICAKRDPKGLYAQAESGEIDTLIGWNTPYVPPVNPEIILDTNTYDTEQLCSITETFLKAR